MIKLRAHLNSLLHMPPQMQRNWQRAAMGWELCCNNSLGVTASTFIAMPLVHLELGPARLNHIHHVGKSHSRFGKGRKEEGRGEEVVCPKRTSLEAKSVVYTHIQALSGVFIRWMTGYYQDTVVAQQTLDQDL
jgi:hypothetical protein